MSGFGRALGGLLAGYGQGLATQAKFDMERAAKVQDDDALMRRQLALQTAQAESAAKLEAYKADRKDVSTAREIALRAAADQDKDARKFGNDVRLKQIDFDNDVKKLGIKFSQDQRLEAFKAQQDIVKWNATTGAQNPIVRTIVSEDGQLYGVTKDGSSKPLAQGVKFPKAQGLDALLMGLNGDGEEGGGAPAPAPSPSPTKAPTAAPSGGDTYTKAEYDAGLAKYANVRSNELLKQGKPVPSSAQIKREWDERLRGMGLRLTTGG